MTLDIVLAPGALATLKSLPVSVRSGVVKALTVHLTHEPRTVTEKPYDLAFAVRVGAPDGRHPDAGRRAVERIRKALVKHGRLFIDGGNPLKEVLLDMAYHQPAADAAAPRG